MRIALRRIRTECCEGAVMRTFAKDSRTNGCALLITGEKPGEMRRRWLMINNPYTA